MRINLPLAEAIPLKAENCRAYVAGGDSRKVGIVNSVLGHLGVNTGGLPQADLIVLVNVNLETIRKCRQSVGDTCWILALTETLGAGVLMSAGASDVLSGQWSVNELCDRIDVALAAIPRTQSGVVFGNTRMN